MHAQQVRPRNIMKFWNKEASRLYAELLPSRADDMHASGQHADDVWMTCG